MKKRDLEILKSLETFKCLERDQIATLHFSKNANPVVTANRVLKRLRDSGHILANTNRSFKPYIYFLNPSPIKIDSSKVDHYLMIAQTVIDMMKYDNIKEFKIETGLNESNIIPDIQVKGWLNNDWFIECQNSVYTSKQLHSKLGKYKDYYNKGYWNNERILIVGKINLNFKSDDYPFKVRQIASIEELKESIDKFKKMKSKNVIKSNNGVVKIRL